MEEKSSVVPLDLQTPSSQNANNKIENPKSIEDTALLFQKANENLIDDTSGHENKNLEDNYSYINTDRFTSEIFKIEVGNLPKFFGFGECKKLLTKKLKLKAHKISLVKHIRKAYVTFKTEEDKKEAVEKLKEFQYKGKHFDVKNAKPKADVMAVKRHSNEESSESPDSKLKKTTEALSSEEILKNSVIPWWKKSYPEQLDEKQKNMCQSLVDLRKKLGSIPNLDKEVFRWIMKNKQASGQCCPTKPILASPVTLGYRNKCGFTVGKNLQGYSEVGFRLGKYRNQTCAVEPPTCLVHVSDQMKKIAASFSKHVRNSKLNVYDRQLYQGHWKQLLLRTSRNNMVMAIIALSKQKLTDEELEHEQKAVQEHFKENGIAVDSLLFRVITDDSNSSIDSTPATVYDGEGVIYENLLGLKFRISPDAFFQCNTLGAEILYSCVKDMTVKKLINETEFSEMQDSENVVLLDVCCGTGTIGLCLANSVQKVFGIDVCKEAIEDAKINAKLNGIENADFQCNKAEDALPDLIRRLSKKNTNIVAVVDPPRSGLHQRVIKAIRQCDLIRKLIYVSCSIDQAKSNIVDLCRPPSKRIHGPPFIPVLAQPIDLFPHTAHCELVLLLERISNDSAQQSIKDASVSKSQPSVTATSDEKTINIVAASTSDFIEDISDAAAGSGDLGTEKCEKIDIAYSPTKNISSSESKFLSGATGKS